MTGAIDPLSWINENPLLLAIIGGVMVATLTAIPRATRRFWTGSGHLIAIGFRWLASLRVVRADRVKPSLRTVRSADLAPVRLAIRYWSTGDGGTKAFVGNTASGTARRVRVDDGNGTRVFDDAMFAEIEGSAGVGLFRCWIDDLSALAQSATFRVRWVDLLGVEHYEVVDALPGQDPSR